MNITDLNKLGFDASSATSTGITISKEFYAYLRRCSGIEEEQINQEWEAAVKRASRELKPHKKLG